jgi:hypothetical protein
MTMGANRTRRKETNMPTEQSKLRTKQINKLQRKHPGTRRQRSAHGCDKWSVQFFDKITGNLVADYNLQVTTHE